MMGLPSMLLMATISGTAATAGLTVFSFATVLCFYRLILGPTLPDRVVALELIANLLTASLMLHGIAGPAPNSIRVALVLALVNFVGTIGFSVYVKRKGVREGGISTDD